MSDKTILIVDDSPSVLAILGDMLREAGYQVHEAQNGQEALNLAQIQKFDLIMTDLSMPVMDGTEFIRRAKALPLTKFVPIVMLTSESDSEKLQQAKAAGAATSLGKPFRATQLKAILQLVLGASRPATPASVCA